MRNKIYSILLAASAICALPSCDKEASFYMKPGEGQLNCRYLSVDYISSRKNVRSESVELGDFKIDFINTATNDTARSFKYSEMPEIVSLPAGNYRAEAEYGENPVSDWENPYYLGNTEFSITAGEITDDVDPVECILSNIRVTVSINDLNQGLLGNDAQVVVSAGKEGELTYNQNTTGKAGYFRYVENSHTLVASFSGTVDGEKVDPIPLVYDNVEAGNSYEINFTVNRPDNMEPGYIVIGGEEGNEITIHATITIKDETYEIDPGDDKDPTFTDNLRPQEGGKDPVDDPKDETNGPKITSTAEGMTLGKPYEVVDGSPVKFNVSSETGITGFNIIIESETLTQDVLESVELTNELDLVNPGEFEEKLNGLGFPTGDDVKGQTSIDFDISQFVPLLGMLGSGDHKFHLTVTDNNGTTKAIVWLKN